MSCVSPDRSTQALILSLLPPSIPRSPPFPSLPPSSPSQELYESELQRSERLSGQLQRAKEEAIESKTKLRYMLVYSIECVGVGRVTTYQLNCNARM